MQSLTQFTVPKENDDEAPDIGNCFEQRKPNEGMISIHESLCMHSSFICINLSGKSLLELPQLTPTLQRIILTHNNICSLQPLEHIEALRYLDVAYNEIQSIPESFSGLLRLEVLIANNNNIKTLPALKTLKFMQMSSNPIRLISTQLYRCGALQRISFDWLHYYAATQGSGTLSTSSGPAAAGLFNRFLNKLSKLNQNGFSEIGLQAFLQYFTQIDQESAELPKYLYLAVTRGHDEFFEYLDYHRTHTRALQRLIVSNNSLSIFQLALKHKCQSALRMLKDCQFPKNFGVQFLHLCCRYANKQMAQMLVDSRGYSWQELDSSGSTPLHELLASFSPKNIPLLEVVLSNTLDYNPKNRRRLNPIMHAAQTNPNNFIAFLKYLHSCQEECLLNRLKDKFDFNQACGLNYRENVLTLCARSGQVEAVKLLTDPQFGLSVKLDPFCRTGARPRNIKSLLIVKKLIMVYEKNFMRRRLFENEITLQRFSLSPKLHQQQANLGQTENMFELQNCLLGSKPLSCKIHELSSYLLYVKKRQNKSRQTRELLQIALKLQGHSSCILKDLILSELRSSNPRSIPNQIVRDRASTASSLVETYELYETFMVSTEHQDSNLNRTAPPLRTRSIAMPWRLCSPTLSDKEAGQSIDCQQSTVLEPRVFAKNKNRLIGDIRHMPPLRRISLNTVLK